MAVCVKDDHERYGLTCNAIANTATAGYEVDFPPILWERSTRLECILKALSVLEQRTEMREE